jgi:hypothetical protein
VPKAAPHSAGRDAAVPELWRRQNGQRGQKYPSALPEISGLAPLPRALRHPAAAAGASGPAVDPTNDALPLGSALTAQTAAEPPPWRAHRGGWPRAAASDLDLFGHCEFINRSYVTTKVSDSASEGCGRAAMHGGQVAAPQPGRARPPLGVTARKKVGSGFSSTLTGYAPVRLT